MNRIRHIKFTALLMLLTLSLSNQVAVAGDGSPPPKEITTIWQQDVKDFAADVSFAPQSDFPYAKLVLPPCTRVIQHDCVVSVEGTNAKGEWTSASFVRPFPLINLKWDDEKFRAQYGAVDDPLFAQARPEIGYPTGSRTGIWRLPTGSGPLDLALVVDFEGQSTDLNAPLRAGNLVSWNRGMGVRLSTFDSQGSNTTAGCSGFFIKASYICPPTNTVPFPQNSKFRVTINMAMTLAAISEKRWFLGQVSNSKVSEQLNKDGSRTLVFEGSPILAGTVFAKVDKKESNYQFMRSALVQSALKYLGQEAAQQTEKEYTYQRFLDDPGSINFSLYSLGTLEAWEELEKVADFYFNDESQTWRFQTLNIATDDRKLLDSCSYTKLRPGLIANNATAMRMQPPSWDEINRELVYRVASPHLRRNGDKNLGFYELSVDQGLAECLWGQDALQFKVTVIVESAEGMQKISTSALSTKNGYVRFRAAGFTFSTSRIRVSMAKDAKSPLQNEDLPDYFMDLSRGSNVVMGSTATNTPVKPQTPVPSPTSSVGSDLVSVKVKTIVCTKNKAKRKVTGVAPRCPKGFKKS